MPIPTREELKAFLVTGVTPSQAQMQSIIDAMFDLAQQSLDAAAAAAAAASSLMPAAMGLVKLRVTIPGGTSNSTADAPVTYREEGCTIIVPTPAAVGGSSPRTLNHLFTINLDEANADVEYAVFVYRAETRLGVLESVALTARTAGQITFTVPVLHTAGAVECWVSFVIYP
jgi:hypothetical protein